MITILKVKSNSDDIGLCDYVSDYYVTYWDFCDWFVNEGHVSLFSMNCSNMLFQITAKTCCIVTQFTFEILHLVMD